MANSLLERQVRKYLSFLSPEELKKFTPFFESIEEGYEGFEYDRKQVERSLEISSEEFYQVNQALKESSQEKQNIIDQLLESINKMENQRGIKGGITSITLHNVTEYLKKLIDENIQNQEQLEILNRAINTSNVTVIVWEKEKSTGKKSIKFVSKNIEKNFGYAYADFLSGKLAFEDIVLLEDREIYQKSHTLDSPVQGTIQSEYRVKDKNGHVLWVNEEDMVEIKDNGFDLEYEGIIVDITSLKQKQQEIQDSERYLSAVVSNIGEGICVLDADKNIKLINQTGINLFRVEEDKIIGENFFRNLEFSHVNNEESYTEILSKHFESGDIEIIFDDICIRRSDKIIPVSIVISPLKGFVGANLQGWIIVFRDKTKEKELEDIKSEFLAIASHELRTPMTVINGYSSLLLEEKVGQINESQKNYLSRIKTNTTQLINLVNDMLTLSKLESGKMSFENTKFDFGGLVQDIISTFSVSAEAKNIHLEGDAKTSYVYSDRAKINQVLLNLVGNALKFTGNGGTIKVGFSEDVEKDLITVTVKDNGGGIKESDTAKLFSKFYQVTQHLDKKDTGTGLGLSICKNIITQMGGTIGVKSEYGKGSEFYFTLPKKSSYVVNENILQ